ncbi:hypothetical protein EPO33_04810 [Patescibacteria group bacterium]|nr:MAG: hypothetical protein EPO33_04810 [Patescibacteria group bacterium]
MACAFCGSERVKNFSERPYGHSGMGCPCRTDEGVCGCEPDTAEEVRREVADLRNMCDAAAQMTAKREEDGLRYALACAEEFEEMAGILPLIANGELPCGVDEFHTVRSCFAARCSLERALMETADSGLAARLLEIDDAIGLDASVLFDLIEVDEYEAAMKDVAAPPRRWWTLGSSPGLEVDEATFKEIARWRK